VEPRALTSLEKAEAAMMAAEGGPDDDLYDRALGHFYAALRRLLRTPAPHLGALATKIELAVDHEAATLADGEPCMAALKQDARRLAASSV
jgi:hypothetical protein